MAYNPQEDFQHIMDMSQKQQDALRQKNTAALKASEEEAAQKSAGGKSGDKEKPSRSRDDKKDTGLADAMQAARANWVPGAIPAFPGSGNTPLVVSNAHQLVMNELIQRGVRPEVAAGAVGSLMGESGNRLNPRAYNPNDNGGPSGGIAQWHNERLQNLYNFAGTTDINKIPLETQIKFLGHELDTTHSKVLDGLRQGRTVADGVNVWTRSYEVPAHADEQVALRMKHADGVWSAYQNSQNAPVRNDTVPNVIQSSSTLAGVDNRLINIMNAAAQKLPEGYSVRATSGEREQSYGFHPKGLAADFQIVGPKGPISNRGEDTTGLYTQLAKNAYAAQQQLYPDLSGKLAWGGAFATVPGGHVADLMHFDLGGERGNLHPEFRPSRLAQSAPSTGQAAIPTYASVHMDDRSLPPNARSYMDTWNEDDMAKRARSTNWKDAGAQENAQRHPDTSTDRLPPRRPSEYDDPRLREGIPTIDRGLPPAAASGPNPTVNAPLPPHRPAGEITPATSGPQHHANYGPPIPNIGPPAPASAHTNPPTPPASSERPHQPAPLPPASSERPQTTAIPATPGGDWHNGMPKPGDADWHAPMAAPDVAQHTQQAGAPQQPQAQPAADSDPFGEFASWLGSLFGNPDNLNGSAETSQPAPAADAGVDFDLGAGLSSIGDAVSSFFAGFQHGGPVHAYASGGLVAKDGTRGRPDRVASAQPGTAIPAADRGTPSGGSYTATIATRPGYALGGPVDDEDGAGDTVPAGTEELAPALAPPATSVAAVPTERFGDVEPILGPNSQELKQQAALEKYAEQRRISQEMHRPRNLRELIAGAIGGVLHDAQEQYGLHSAAQRQQRMQGQGIATEQDQGDDPMTALGNMIFGLKEQAASPQQVQTMAKAVDPEDKLTDAARTLAGMYAGIIHSYKHADPKGAQEIAQSFIGYSLLQSATLGDNALKDLRKGNTADAVKKLVEAQNIVPDGTVAHARPTKDGGAEFIQKDQETGQVVQQGRMSQEELVAFALNTKNGTIPLQALAQIAQGGTKFQAPASEAYRQWQNQPQAQPAIPTDPNSPQYKLHQEAIGALGPMPQIPANLSQMNPDEQKEVLAQVNAQRQAWTPQYTQYMQGGRQQEGFRYRDTNREDNQSFRREERVAGQDYRTGERVAGQEYRTGERVAGQEYRSGEAIAREKRAEERAANKPVTAQSMDKIQQGVMNAFDTLNQTFKVENPQRQAAIKSAAAGLRAADPSVTDEDAVRAAAAITSRGADVQIGEDGRTLVMPDGRTFKALPNVIEMRKHIATPPQATAPQQPSASW